jgi:bifunctional non-homologous end joining protein LigD
MPWRNSPRSRRTPPAGFIQPCQPTLVAYPPAGPGWLHEVKHDGYRLIARKDAGRVVLWSRYGTDFTDKLPRIVEAVRNFTCEQRADRRRGGGVSLGRTF